MKTLISKESLGLAKDRYEISVTLFREVREKPGVIEFTYDTFANVSKLTLDESAITNPELKKSIPGIRSAYFILEMYQNLYVI